MDITVDMDGEMLERARAQAAAAGRTLDEFIKSALVTYLRRETVERIAQRSETSDVSSVDILRAGRERSVDGTCRDGRESPNTASEP